jgi:hypothetical protein
MIISLFLKYVFDSFGWLAVEAALHLKVDWHTDFNKSFERHFLTGQVIM